MRIAAIYIETHEYLFDEPQTINLGGRYFYNFVNEDGTIIVSRKHNELYIPNFFDLTNLKSKITNINAVVGQNGAGKSTILDIFRSAFIENGNALPSSKTVFIVESEDENLPKILRSDFKKVLFHTELLKNKDVVFIKKGTIQTIYYSPHFDYKLNPNFDNIDAHDLSFDKILAKDLDNLNEKDSNENGWPYSASYELLFKNSIRQIEFLSSDLVERQQIFKDLFHLQNHYEPILHFRGYKDSQKEWNTPYEFRTILKLISEKIEEELNDWIKIRKFDKDHTEVQNQVEVNGYILKRNVIKSIISLLYKQMERKNSFLQKGIFPTDDLKEELDSFNSYELFLLFVKKSTIHGETLFDENNTKMMLEKIFDTIEKSKDEESVSNGTLKTSMQNAVEILRLQRNFLNELNSYHIKFYSNKDELLIDENEKIEEFINYMPFSRRMSSGENSLLNFYSRIYNFLINNYKDLRTKKDKEHFILLLDEADLTFHLSWKKKYVKALLKTLPYFFNELNNKPSIQIIFTTHDPLTLSDMPNTNVIYLSRINYDSKTKVLDYDDINRPHSTFGANIADLISNSFFIEDSLIGDFAFDKIYKTIDWLNKTDEIDNIEDIEYFRKLIMTIDEPIVQRKLAEMYDTKMDSNYQLTIIEEQINKLEKLRAKLRK